MIIIKKTPLKTAYPNVDPAPKIEAKYIVFLKPNDLITFTEKILEKNLINLFIDNIKPTQKPPSIPKNSFI